MQADDSRSRPMAMNDDQSDEALVHGARRCLSVAHRALSKSRLAVVESLQDVFIKVYFKLVKFRFESKFSTWLYTATYRTTLSHLRKVKVQFEELNEKRQKGHRISKPEMSPNALMPQLIKPCSRVLSAMWVRHQQDFRSGSWIKLSVFEFGQPKSKQSGYRYSCLSA